MCEQVKVLSIFYCKGKQLWEKLFVALIGSLNYNTVLNIKKKYL